MKIGGVQKLTLLDYPEKTAAIVFVAGCNFRCGFCHNPQFVDPENINEIKDFLIPEDKFFNFLETRKGLLDGVVVSGGEPTVFPDLPQFIKKIKDLDFLVKLDTNGTNPEMIKKLIAEKLIDFIAMDVKMSPENYENIVGVKVDGSKIKESIALILSAKIPHEFRTTVLQKFHNKIEIEKIVKLIKGADKFALQNFRNEKTLDPKFHKFHGFDSEELNEFKKIAEKYVSDVEVRG
jgi:pyruvate formate lyase activating enzyme